MADGDVSAAWSRYRETIEQIYERSVDEIAEIRDAQIREPPGDDLIARALVRSDELRAVILAELLSNNSGVRRELALTQLGAAATIDLSIADDLARYAPEDTDPAELAEFAEPSLANTLTDAARVLAASGEEPWQGIIAGGAGPPAYPRCDLALAVRSASDTIIDKTHDVLMSTVKDLIGPAANYLVVATSQPTEHVFREMANHVGRIRRAAINFALSGIKKLLAFLGVDADMVSERVSHLVEHALSVGLRDALTTLYRSDHMDSDLMEQIVTAQSTDRMEAAERELGNLRTRFTRHMEVTNRAVETLNKVRRWLFHVAPPYSHIGVAAAYAIATGFTLAAGGDYLDAIPIDFVPGVRIIVSEATT